MISKDTIYRKIAEYVTNDSVCGVKGCEKTHEVEVRELQPLDPIDHDSTFAALCADHQVWADERNEFAEAMRDKLRDARKDIGQEHIGEIQELALPQSEDMREDILMGEAEGMIPLEKAFDKQPRELESVDEKKQDIGDLLTGGDGK